jgi:D-galactarolactone cycloisomerase
MKIIGIRGYHLGCRLPEAQGNASGWYDQRASLIIELIGDNGLSGWGETWHSPGAAAGAIRETFAPLVLGVDARNRRALWTSLAFRLGYDRQGVGMMAISAIDMALWDLIARSEGVSIAALLGGRLRDRVFVYASGPYFRPNGAPYRDYVREAEGYRRAGFRAIKMKVGVTGRADGDVAKAVRRAIGSDCALMVDGNHGYTARSAINAAGHMEEADLLWFEEPVLPNEPAAYQRIIDAVPMAIAGGEALGGINAFRDFLFPETLFDIVQPDLAICGGFSEVMRVAALADAASVPVVPHVWGTAINLYASLQLTAVLPGRHSGAVAHATFPWLELDRSPNPLRTFCGEPPLADDGTVSIPDGPGLGIEISAADFEAFISDSWSLNL